jgi:hypothetical protein
LSHGPDWTIGVLRGLQGGSMILVGRRHMTRRHLSTPRRRGPGLALGALVVVALVALVPAVAQARPPRITAPPVIAGTPQVGETLVAEGAEWDPHGEATATWQWQRCDGAVQRNCDSIPGATAISYIVDPADLGKHLRVRLDVFNDDGSAWSLSDASAAVTSPTAPEPEPEPSPSPDPSPSPEPEPSPSPDPSASPSPEPPVQPATAAQTPMPAGGVLDQQVRSVRMMDPAPIVRIRGRLTRSGARITLLTVRAPRGARIAVRCLGRGCPARRWAGIASLTRIARFQGSYRSGTRLVVTVTKRGWIGKHTTIAFRRGAAPTRRDRCLMPGARKPVRCPAA